MFNAAFVIVKSKPKTVGSFANINSVGALSTKWNVGNVLWVSISFGSRDCDITVRFYAASGIKMWANHASWFVTWLIALQNGVLWQSWTSSNLEVGQNESPLVNNASSAMVMLRLDKFMTLLNVVRWCLGFMDTSFTFLAFQ